MSQAYESLVVAADKFDDSRGIRFETYASNYIRAWLTKVFYKECGYSKRTVFISDMMYEKQGVYDSIDEQLEEKEERELGGEEETSDVIYKICSSFPLKPKEKELYIKRYVNGLSIEEILESGAYPSKNAVKLALFRLRNKLKKINTTHGDLI